MALSISLISLLITGLDVSATAQVAYARAFTMAPLRGIQKYLRGAAGLILLLAGTGAALTLRSVAASHPLWVAIVAGAVLIALQFGFFLVSPRLLLDLPFAWRDLIPGAAICTGAAIVVHAVSALFLRNWLGVYGHAYGGFGISLALAAFTGIIASFWVWIAAVMGVWWERKAGPVVAQPCLGHLRVAGGVDRPAERARVAEARVVDQHRQDVQADLWAICRAGLAGAVFQPRPSRSATEATSANGAGSAALTAASSRLRWPAMAACRSAGSVDSSSSSIP